VAMVRYLRCHSTVVVTSLLRGGGGGSGHMADPVSGESWPASLALILSARVPMGRPCGPIRILAVCLYAGHVGGESGTGMTSIDSSSSSSSTTVTSTTSSTSAAPSSPSLIPVMTTLAALAQLGTGMGPYRGWRRAVPGDPTKRWPGLRVPSANRSVVWGRETAVVV
jgi:hypothetical protein